MQLVADAIAATVAGRTARLALSVRRGLPLGKELLVGERGLVDFAARRAQLRDGIGRESLYDGQVEYVRGGEGERWTRMKHGGSGPFWPLELEPSRVVEHRRAGTRRHRDELVDRHVLVLSRPPREPHALERLRGRPPRELPPLELELWTGLDGRIRMASSSARPPAIERDLDDASPFMRDFARMLGLRGRPLWRTVEYGSFGVPAPIAVPGPDEIGPAFGLDDVKAIAKLGREAWRHREEVRDYFRGPAGGG